jgi:hypothetical protein
MRNLDKVGASIPGFAGRKFNYRPDEIARDQTLQLYLMLYPFIAADFAHREDLNSWASDVKNSFDSNLRLYNSSLSQAISLLRNHVHPTPSGPSSPSVELNAMQAPSLDGWRNLPSDKVYNFGENLITGDSSFTGEIKHRQPETGPRTYSPLVNIPEEYRKLDKYVPVDVFTSGGSENYIQKQQD